ncbi:hypothetical protein, partial [Klebsiella pneumoniae]|uniref:hypothetical protein n=1 Tax=Klebsiella pneumoniae TaxID=573 RepID=UPI001AF0143C
KQRIVSRTFGRKGPKNQGFLIRLPGWHARCLCQERAAIVLIRLIYRLAKYSSIIPEIKYTL